MLDDRGGISPFGWAVACGGRTPSQVQDDVRSLVEWSASAWKRHFPSQRGYQVSVDASADTAQGVRLSVRRCDFHASVAVEHDPPSEGQGGISRGPSVRMFGRAQSDILQQAHERGKILVQRSRVIGAVGGVGMFLSLAWLMIGVNNPIYVLGGMLLVVALLLTVMAGSTLGAWVGERLAEMHRSRARRAVDLDVGLDHDIRRWKAVARQLGSQRSALLGSRRQPFRSEPRVLAS